MCRVSKFPRPWRSNQQPQKYFNYQEKQKKQLFFKFYVLSSNFSNKLFIVHYYVFSTQNYLQKSFRFFTQAHIINSLVIDLWHRVSLCGIILIESDNTIYGVRNLEDILTPSNTFTQKNV